MTKTVIRELTISHSRIVMHQTEDNLQLNEFQYYAKQMFTQNKGIRIYGFCGVSISEAKLKNFNSNVKSVLLYGCESWKTGKITENKLQVFINRCLRKILKIIWPEIISNQELWEKSGQKEIKFEIKKRKWNWIGHTLRKENGPIEKTALDWNPQGNRRR